MGMGSNPNPTPPSGFRTESPEVYALVGGRVVTVNGPSLDEGTVVLRDGVIEAVGSRVAVPPDARVIDVSGLVLTPGLIDGYSTGDIMDHRTEVTAVYIDGAAQPLETKHTRLYEEYKDRP